MSDLITDTVILTEESYKDFIADGRTIIRTWDEGCGYCTKYEPIFDEYVNETKVKSGVLRIYVLKDKRSSEFKRSYMRQDKSENIKETVPGTFVFENGELKARHFGLITKEQLARLVEKFEAPVQEQKPAPKTIQEYAKSATVIELKASLFEMYESINATQQSIGILRDELGKRGNA